MTLLCLDFDSTISTKEWIDDLWDLAGKKEAIATLTHNAMSWIVPVEDVFGKRLELICPTEDMVRRVASETRRSLTPWMSDALRLAQKEHGYTIHIISWGYTQIIGPTADDIGIQRGHIHAVELYFDTNGNYSGYDTDFPTTRSGGKIELIEQLRDAHSWEKIIMVGDGKTDLETAPFVDTFILFIGVVDRWLDISPFPNARKVSTSEELLAILIE